MNEPQQGDQRFGTAAQAAEWDARYSERDAAMWSGRPNGRLVAEVAGLIPGVALDSVVVRAPTRAGSLGGAGRSQRPHLRCRPGPGA